MAFVSRKRVGAMRERRWIRSFARPAVAVVAAMREEQRRSKRVGSFRAEGVAEARRARRACSGDWFVRGRLEQGRRRRSSVKKSFVVFSTR